MTDRTEYELKSTQELFELYRNNMLVISTAVTEIMGDDPMPDPRELAHFLGTVTFDRWMEMWENPEARKYITQNLDLMRAVNSVQAENVMVLEAMMGR